MAGIPRPVQRAAVPAPRPVLPPALQIRPTKYPNPFNGDAFAPLNDAGWVGIPAAVWNTSAVTPPPVGLGPDLSMPAATDAGPTRYASTKLTQQTLVIGTEPKAILAERENRQYLLIQNATGSGVIYIGFSEVPNINTGIEIIAGGSYELRAPAPSNQVYVVCPGGTATVRVLEG